MVPGRTYVYPLTLLSNQGYSGAVKLSIASTPPDPTFTYRFDPETVELTEISKATLTLTTTRDSSPALHMLSVRGTDAASRSNDAGGKQVARGDAGGPPQELEAGEYRVVVKVADQELSEQVIVTPASDLVLRVALKGDKFVIER